MRTTLDIEDDVLQAARELAQKEKSSAGSVISRLARAGLVRQSSDTKKVGNKHGVPVFAARAGEVVTLEHVQKLMDAEGI